MSRSTSKPCRLDPREEQQYMPSPLELRQMKHNMKKFTTPGLEDLGLDEVGIFSMFICA